MRDSKRSVPTDAKLRNLHASVTLKLLGSLCRVLLFSCCFLELSLATQLVEEGNEFVVVNNCRREDFYCVLHLFVMSAMVLSSVLEILLFIVLGRVKGSRVL